MTWTTAEARSIICPRCKAAIGQPCKGRAVKHHQARIDSMVAARRAKALGARVVRRSGKVRAAALTQTVTITGAAYRQPRSGEAIDYTDVF